MKKLLVFLSLMFAGAASATTVNIDWLMDGATYAQTTCETGGNFTVPTPTPTKYGYHFVGWQQNDAIGSWSQSGTPTPDNPIEPIFRQFGNTVLRALGSGDNFIADSYDPTTGKITRRVGVKVLDGTENWVRGTAIYTQGLDLGAYNGEYTAICSHFQGVSNSQQGSGLANTNKMCIGNYVHTPDYKDSIYIYGTTTDFPDVTTWTNWLKAQYDAGTPVTIYYPLAEPVEENYNAQ